MSSEGGEGCLKVLAPFMVSMPLSSIAVLLSRFAVPVVSGEALQVREN